MGIEIVDRIVDLSKKGLTMELREELMVWREENLSLREKVRELTDENAKLKASADVRSSLSFEDGLYWRTQGASREGPFCQPCWAGAEKLSHLHDYGNRWHCLLCGKSTFTSEQRAKAGKVARPRMQRF